MTDLFTKLLVIFLASLAMVALCRPLKLPATLGYFFAGALVGPTGLGWVKNPEDLALLAELGVVLLLFTLGLEFSLPRMLSMRRAVFGLGSMQVVLTTTLFAGTLAYAGLDLGLAIVIGGGLALSSTALVSRELAVTGQLQQRHGQTALGILLFQDLAAVLFLILVPALATDGAAGLGLSVAVAAGKGVALFVGLMAVGRYVLPPLFHEIARSRSEELFVLSALAVVLGAAWLTHALHMSMALGGFVGGMMLGESRYRHQLEADIRPFRDLLLGVFLVSVGMMLDLPLLAEYWPRILAFGLILVLVKFALIALIARALGEKPRDAVRSAVVLAQGGEFAFALLALAASYGLVPADVQAFMVAVTLVSMVLTPALVRGSGVVTDRILGPAERAPLASLSEPLPAASGRVLILGYGRVGQVIGRMLEETGVPYGALDSDPARVNEAALAGVPIRFGDAARSELQRGLGLESASLVVVCIDDWQGALRALTSARELNPTVPILVRSRDDRHMEAFLAAGATEVVPETFESSLMLFTHLMALLRHDRADTEAALDRVRADRYHLLHGAIAGERHSLYPEVLHPVVLPEGARVLGLPAEKALPLSVEAVSLEQLRRGDVVLEVSAAGSLRAGDVLLLVGPQPEVEAVEAALLAG